MCNGLGEDTTIYSSFILFLHLHNWLQKLFLKDILSKLKHFHLERTHYFYTYIHYLYCHIHKITNLATKHKELADVYYIQKW